MTTVFDVKARIDKEVSVEGVRIAGGGCSTPDHTADQVAMEYRERTGFIQGLLRALQLIEELERDGG